MYFILQWDSYSINEHDLHKPAYLVPLILLNRAVLSHCVEGSFILINWKSSGFNYILIRKKTYFLYVQKSGTIFSSMVRTRKWKNNSFVHVSFVSILKNAELIFFQSCWKTCKHLLYKKSCQKNVFKTHNGFCEKNL